MQTMRDLWGSASDDELQKAATQLASLKEDARPVVLAEIANRGLHVDFWACPCCNARNGPGDTCCVCCKAARGSDPGAREQSSGLGAQSSYTSTYHTARALAQFISVLGWIAVVVAILIVLIAFSRDRNAGFVALLPGLLGIMSGLVTVAVGQLTRAAVDTADNTGEVLAVLKSALRQNFLLPQRRD